MRHCIQGKKEPNKNLPELAAAIERKSLHESGKRKAWWPELMIGFGASLFIFVLWLSACFAPDIRWLHFFQSWMYFAAIGLSLRRSRWGYFIGISAAGLWDYINLFVNSFLRSGLHWLAMWVSTGKLNHPDQIIAVPAWGANFLVFVDCICAYMKLPLKRSRDWFELVFAFVVTTSFFAAAVALFQPRYLPLLRGIIHPHWPW